MAIGVCPLLIKSENGSDADTMIQFGTISHANRHQYNLAARVLRSKNAYCDLVLQNRQVIRCRHSVATQIAKQKELRTTLRGAGRATKSRR